MKYRWDGNSRYKSWVKQRDRAAEDLHTRAQLEMADLMRDALAHVLMVCKAQFQGIKDGHTHAIDLFESSVRWKFDHLANDLYGVIWKLRSRAYTLARASESEIIAQLSPGKQVRATVDRHNIENIKHKRSMAGGVMLQRIKLYCDRLRRKIVSAAQAYAMTENDPNEFAKAVMATFPRSRRVNVPRRILKPKLMEAQSIGNKADVAIDNVDDDTWDDMLDAYMNDYVPKSRAPEYVVDIPTTEGEVWYAWEMERDMTNEFVSAVRSGQIDAANEAGITDFVWIAVLDDKTDECCAWRDGLLISEIEDQLEDHQDEDHACDIEGDGLNPPLHFNCRCTLAPATDNVPDKPDDGTKDFDDWLNS